MKVMNPIASSINPLVQNERKPAIARNHSLAPRDSFLSSSEPETLSRQERLRVVRVAADKIDIQAFGANPSDSVSNLVQRNSPTGQYQANQSLLSRESLTRESLRAVIGVDLYA